jgi:hypothetical protein
LNQPPIILLNSGHSERVYAMTPMLEHLLAGVQYALGDLQADDSPSGKAARSNAQRNDPTIQRSNDPTIQRSNDPREAGRKSWVKGATKS